MSLLRLTTVTLFGTDWCCRGSKSDLATSQGGNTTNEFSVLEDV